MEKNKKTSKNSVQVGFEALSLEEFNSLVGLRNMLSSYSLEIKTMRDGKEYANECVQRGKLDTDLVERTNLEENGTNIQTRELTMKRIRERTIQLETDLHKMEKGSNEAPSKRVRFS
eukprot:snap_masked-scaffold_55-processed-gene-0.31-mRNA-1 protein AED:1.00 eAED:1.00 QI:0/-1/0/0/-1/1/1/0/116